MRSAGDLLAFSWTELRRQQRRVLPGLIGVAAGVGLLLAVVAGSNWLSVVTNNGILGQRSLHQILVTPGTNQTFTNDQVKWMGSLKGVSDGYPVVTGAFPVSIGSDGSIMQMSNTPGKADRPDLVTGTWPVGDQVVIADTGLLSRKTGTQLAALSLVGRSVVVSIPISQGLAGFKTVTVEIVGVYRWSPDQGIEHTTFAPIDTLESILTEQGTWLGSSDPSGSAGFGTYVIDADSPHDVAGIAAQLESHGLSTQYVEQTVHGLSGRVESIQAAAAVLVVLIAAFAGLSISNTLLQAVRQRGREIAILLTVGFSPAWIGASFVAEAAFIGLAGVVVGLAAAEAAVLVLSRTEPGVALGISPSSVALVGLSALGICLAASWLPMARAMAVDPVSVLRGE